MSKHFVNKEILNYIPLDIAEKKIDELTNQYKQSLDNVKKEFVAFINNIKRTFPIKGEVIYKLGLPVLGMNEEYEIGIPVGLLAIDGVQLYTGDEVSWYGERGFIGKQGNDVMYITNRTIATINRDIGEVKASSLVIEKHFYKHKNGDEIAKGRKGHKGFIVNIKEIKYE